MASLGSAGSPAAAESSPARSPEPGPVEDSAGLLGSRCVCPACHGALVWRVAAIDCPGCGASYRREDGIPVFTNLDETSTDAEVRLKLDQVEFFDAEGAEWEISRPHGAPALYGRLMAEKFARSVAGLEACLPGAAVLTVCGGSGMDAEFLARAGALVVASDISLGAARRVRERGRRHGAAITPIVADVEHLPFADRTVAVVYVHDGLHHLSDPERGLAEMLRVADRAVVVSEPARAAVTRLAVALGVAETVEESGNRVERIEPARVAEVLRAAGFRLIGSDRYAMFYRHVPGPAIRLLSRRRLLPAATAGLGLFNRFLGAIGNKVAVRAVRGEAGSLSGGPGGRRSAGRTPGD